MLTKQVPPGSEEDALTTHCKYGWREGKQSTQRLVVPGEGEKVGIFHRNKSKRSLSGGRGRREDTELVQNGEIVES